MLSNCDNDNKITMARGKMWNVNEWADPLGHLEEMNKKRNIYWGNSIDMWKYGRKRIFNEPQVQQAIIMSLNYKN